MSYKNSLRMAFAISGVIISLGMTYTTLFQLSTVNADYTFTVDGRTGRIDSEWRTYDDNGVYQGDYDFNTGVYTDHNGWTVNVNNTPGVTVYDNNGAEVPKNNTPTETPQATNPACVADGTFTPPANAIPGSCSCSHDGCSASSSICTCQTQAATTSTGSSNGGGGQSSGGYTFTVDGRTGRIDPDGRTYDDRGVYQGNYNFSTGVYTDNNGTSIDVDDMPNVVIHASDGSVVPKRPSNAGTSTGSTSTGSTALQSDFNQYWVVAPSGSVVTVWGGTVTRNADGSATYRNGNYTYTYNQNTPIDEVARNVPMLAQEWTRQYGYTPPAENTTTPFTDFESYKAWEAAVYRNARFASNYEVPDYLRMMGLAQGGGDDEAFKRYVFFKANPQYAEDYARIYQGQLSRYETDGSTLIKSNLNNMPPEIADYYRNNPADLRAAEGFNFDPVLARKVYTGEITLPYWVNATTWLQTHKWTENGVVLNNNLLSSNGQLYIGLDGKGSWNYVQMKYDTNTGYIVDFDGTLYDPVTGEKKGKVDPSKFYGPNAVVTTSTGSTTQTSNGGSGSSGGSGGSGGGAGGTTTPTTTTVTPTGSTTSVTIQWGNTLGLTLSESTNTRLKSFAQKVATKRSKYSSDAQYIQFVDKLITKLSALETANANASGSVKTSIKYLVVEIGKIRTAYAAWTSSTTLTDAQFVAQTYEQILKRNPEAAGSAYWVGTLTSGQTTRSTLPVVLACAARWVVTGSASNATTVVIWNPTTNIVYWNSASTQTTVVGGNDKANATAWLAANGKSCN